VAYVRVSVSRVLTVISLALGFCVTAESAPKYKVLHSFIVSDGSGPYGGVVLGQGGDLYGTTVGGGLGKCGLYNCGTVFRLTPQANGKWAESVLYSFQGGYDGADPLSSLILDAFGNIYGTATGGGLQSWHCLRAYIDRGWLDRDRPLHLLRQVGVRGWRLAGSRTDDGRSRESLRDRRGSL